MDVCEETLNILPIVNELNYVDMNKDIGKVEQTCKDATCVLKTRELKWKERGK